MTDLVTKRFGELLIASSNLLALPIERNFHPDAAVNFARNNWPLAFGIVIAYLIFISAGSVIMKDYKPFELRLPLAGWNALLCVFSFIGMCRTVKLFPYLFY